MTATGHDAGMAAIYARFGIGAAAAAGDPGGDNIGAVLEAAGLPSRCARRPILPFNLPPGLLTVTTVGAYLDLPHMFGPRTGYFWDITALSAQGFTAGTIGVSKNAPLVTAAGNPWAIEPVGAFTQAGVITFPQKGMPLLDASERLVFTVTSALTGSCQVSGQVVCVPAERIDEYLS